jgi:hypothetical protein
MASEQIRTFEIRKVLKVIRKPPEFPGIQPYRIVKRNLSFQRKPDWSAPVIDAHFRRLLTREYLSGPHLNRSPGLQCKVAQRRFSTSEL